MTVEARRARRRCTRPRTRGRGRGCPRTGKSSERAHDVQRVLEAVEQERRAGVLHRVEAAQRVEVDGERRAARPRTRQRVGDAGGVGGVERAPLEERGDDRLREPDVQRGRRDHQREDRGADRARTGSGSRASCRRRTPIASSGWIAVVIDTANSPCGQLEERVRAEVHERAGSTCRWRAPARPRARSGWRSRSRPSTPRAGASCATAAWRHAKTGRSRTPARTQRGPQREGHRGDAGRRAEPDVEHELRVVEHAVDGDRARRRGAGATGRSR